MSAAVVIPLRWTARGFVRAGVVFSTEGGTMRVSGPEDRPDLYDALIAEVARRVDVFVKLAPLDPRSPFPRVGLPGVHASTRSGTCDACGDAMLPYRGGMCELCTVSLQKTLRQLGRLS